MRLIVGLTRATGGVFGVRLLERLAAIPEVETHLVLSCWARATVELETDLSVREVGALADALYAPDDQGAAISSDSFRTDGMIIAPCSMKTLAGIRAGYAEGRCQSSDTVHPQWTKSWTTSSPACSTSSIWPSPRSPAGTACTPPGPPLPETEGAPCPTTTCAASWPLSTSGANCCE